MKQLIIFTIVFFCSLSALSAQEFYFGADQSYVNEMEDCGVEYKENGEVKDVYQIYKDHGCNFVRYRLWHTPSWLDDLNEGKRYSDLADVKNSINRAKQAGMKVLLDFHLSDEWADPGDQIIPMAWLPVVDDLDILKDSLYNYISNTLKDLHAEGLRPDMVQIGNETNKGILQSPEDNQEWKLDWSRNAPLFNSGIRAVRDVSEEIGHKIEIMLHLADPDATTWLLPEFIQNGVTDFDVLGMSYYWAWHKPTSIEETAEIVEMVKENYNKEVIIVETGYIWTTSSNDNAGNIISEVHPDYAPASPENQRDWLIDMTKAVIAAGARGVVYWEPSWVSSPCRTPWGQGSHQEHATFFDFDNNLLQPGGIDWMTYDYGLSSVKDIKKNESKIEVFLSDRQTLIVSGIESKTLIRLFSVSGQLIYSETSSNPEKSINLEGFNPGLIIVELTSQTTSKLVKKLFLR